MPEKSLSEFRMAIVRTTDLLRELGFPMDADGIADALLELKRIRADLATDREALEKIEKDRDYWAGEAGAAAVRAGEGSARIRSLEAELAALRAQAAPCGACPDAVECASGDVPDDTPCDDKL